VSLTSALDGVGGRHTPSTLTSLKKFSTHYTGGWVGHRAGLDGCKQSCPHRNSFPTPSSLHTTDG